MLVGSIPEKFGNLGSQFFLGGGGGEAENFDFEDLASLAKFEKFTAYANMELLILLVSFHFHAHALSPRILVLPPPLPYVRKIIAAASLWCMFSDMILDS